tara:strand:+ start:54 stop:281 length:228 start_codon:yes stop_codon:yes gene_type:complete
MKTIYQKLKPELKIKIQSNARKFSSAKRLKYTLMSKCNWQSLSLDNVAEFFVWTDQYSYKLNGHDIMFGDKFLIK